MHTYINALNWERQVLEIAVAREAAAAQREQQAVEETIKAGKFGNISLPKP